MSSNYQLEELQHLQSESQVIEKEQIQKAKDIQTALEQH